MFVLFRVSKRDQFTLIYCFRTVKYAHEIELNVYLRVIHSSRALSLTVLVSGAHEWQCLLGIYVVIVSSDESCEIDFSIDCVKISSVTA